MRACLTEKHTEEELRPYGLTPTAEFCEKTRAYIELLLRWNRRISLTAVTNPSQILRFHFGESLFAISAAGIRDGRLADVGSGAGFPGVPLAMALPALDVTLIESNVKRAAFLSELHRQLKLDRVHIYHGRADTLKREALFDVVAARAVGRYADLLEWAKMRLTAGGRVVLWLGEQQVENVRMSATWHWQNPVPIPGTRNRFIVVGSPSV
jgi:16S rRNA (guanine527-N7)-methyltransferase